MFYTGVGSRKTPPEIQSVMYLAAVKIARSGGILRSGGAYGADRAFEHGCNYANGLKEIYFASDATQAAADMVSVFHPAWNKLSDYAKKLHARNAFQVLGKELDNQSDLLICWTPDGCINHKGRTRRTGGTGTAISIAEKYGVVIHNLAIPSHLSNIKEWLLS